MTSGQPGELTIVMAFAMALLSGGAFALAAFGNKNTFSLGKKAYYVQIFLALAASAYLYVLIFRHDFSIDYVYSYSSSTLPFYYLISTFWAGQEGTYLLWLVLSSLFGLFILSKGDKYKTPAMFFYALINIFLTVMLMVMSPFKAATFAAPEGAGLNPLLQNFWMVIHPPVMFCAFAMAGVPFALLMAAMVKNDYKGWINIAFPFVILDSVLFFAANVMGGYWAYVTLGWGGYWAWDPVENTSFVPWLISLAMIHGIIIEKRTGSFRRTNILLGCFTFLLVVYGTFLTRSGVLADFSVHSFVDLGTNNILIGFMIFMVLLILGLFTARQKPEIIGKPFKYDIFSVDFIIFVGMTLLFLLGALVLFWSSLPLITSGLGMTPAAADISTYNSFAMPMAIFIALFLTIAPLIMVFRKEIRTVNKGNLIATIIPFFLALFLYILGFMSLSFAAALFIYIAVLLIYSSEAEMAKKIAISLIYGVIGLVIALVLGVHSPNYLFFILAGLTAAGAHVIILKRLIPSNLRVAGGHISHFGLGIMLVGILVSSAYSNEERLILPRDKMEKAFGYDFTYQGTTGSLGNAENEILLTMRKGKTVIHTHPKFYFSQRMNGMMKRPHIVKKFGEDIYLAPLDIQELEGGEGLKLSKGESREVGDYNIKFINFDMLSHGESGGVSVGAELQVTHGDAVDTVKPVLKSGSHGLTGEPVPLYKDSEYNVNIEKVDASTGSVTLAIPGLVETSAPDQLILEVTSKPAINLVWLGAIMICAGMLLTFYRRRNHRTTAVPK